MLEKKKTLRKKFQQLNEEKKQFEKELHDFMMENKNTNHNVNKKVVYNNSSKELSQKQIELLALGLNFAITPKKFPLIEYMTAAEKLKVTAGSTFWVTDAKLLYIFAAGDWSVVS